MIAGIPFDFVLFALTLAGIALFHRFTLAVALGGLSVIVAYKLAFTGFATGPGLGGLATHLAHEWVVLANLFGLLVGFALLAAHFHDSRAPEILPPFSARRLERRLCPAAHGFRPVQFPGQHRGRGHRRHGGVGGLPRQGPSGLSGCDRGSVQCGGRRQRGRRYHDDDDVDCGGEPRVGFACLCGRSRGDAVFRRGGGAPTASPCADRARSGAGCAGGLGAAGHRRIHAVGGDRGQRHHQHRFRAMGRPLSVHRRRNLDCAAGHRSAAAAGLETAAGCDEGERIPAVTGAGLRR